MTRNYFTDILFDLLNDSELLNVHDIVTTAEGYRVTTGDGTVFALSVAVAEPADNVVPLFPRGEK